MADVLEMLRRYDQLTLQHQAANEIEALRAKVERLKVMAWDWQMKHDEQAAEVERLRARESDLLGHIGTLCNTPETARAKLVADAMSEYEKRRADPTTGQ